MAYGPSYICRKYLLFLYPICCEHILPDGAGKYLFLYIGPYMGISHFLYGWPFRDNDSWIVNFLKGGAPGVLRGEGAAFYV